MDRRSFLLGGLGLVAGCETPKTPFEKVRSLEKTSSGEDLNALHGEVANAFNKEVGEQLKGGEYLVDHVTLVLTKEGRRYALAMRAQLHLCPQDTSPDRIFEFRTTLWTGKHARATANATYEKSILPWIGRMREAYPQVVFRQEEQSGGTDALAWKGVVLIGKEQEKK